MRRSLYILLALGIFAVLTCVLGARPLVSHLIEEKAKSRGLSVELGGLILSPTKVRMRHVHVESEAVPGLRADFDSIEVKVRWPRIEVSEIAVLGGEVALDGSWRDLLANLEKLRGPSLPAQSGDAPARLDIVRGVNLTWTNPFGKGEVHRIRGIQLDRRGRHVLLGVDQLALDADLVAFQMAGFRLETAKHESRLAAVSAEELRFSLRLPQGSTELAQPSPVDEELGQDEEESGLEERVQLHPERVALIRRGLALLRGKVLPRLPAQLKVARLYLDIPLQANTLSLGPNLLVGLKSQDDFELTLTPETTARSTQFTASALLTQKGPLKFELQGGPLSLFDLGVKDGQLALSGVRQAKVSADAQFELSEDATHLSAEGMLELTGVVLNTAKLADRPVQFAPLRVRGKSSLALDGSEIALSEMKVQMGQAQFLGAFRLSREEETTTLQAKWEAPLVSCQALVDSAPTALLGEIAQMKFDGNFSLSAGVEARSDQLSKMSVSWDFNNGCKIVSVPSALAPEQFLRLFRLEVSGAGGFPVEREFGPETGRWYGLDEITPYLEKAVLVTEDGRFYRHHGFDDRAIESAIRDNARAGKFVRGASTISMQLAKNLYLSRDKRLSRKLKEAAFTLLLEQEFTKKEILEIYFNVIEFGPDVYGIGAAASHYFNTSPRSLTLSQAFFLASILPAPTRQYFEVDGHLKEGRKKYLHRLLEIAKARDRISEQEYERALQEELIFGEASTAPESEVFEEGPFDPSAPNGSSPHFRQRTPPTTGSAPSPERAPGLFDELPPASGVPTPRSTPPAGGEVAP